MQGKDDSSVVIYKFRGCQELQDITISKGVHGVIVEECPELQSIILPEGIKRVEMIYCPIQSITIPESAEYVYFGECPNLTEINFLNPELEKWYYNQ